MFRRPVQPPADDVNVGPVEELLAAITVGSRDPVKDQRGRVLTTHAVWLCACETFDDAPTWLIYAVEDDGLGWQRLTDFDVPDAVEADHLTGCHPAPSGVLEWLQGKQPYPSGDRTDFPEHSYIYEELTRRISLLNR